MRSILAAALLLISAPVFASDFVITDGNVLPLTSEFEVSGAALDYRWLTLGNFPFYKLNCQGLLLTQTGDLVLQFSADGGVTWKNTGYNSLAPFAATNLPLFSGALTTKMVNDIGIRVAIAPTDGPGTTLRAELNNIASAMPKQALFREFHWDGANYNALSGGGSYTGADASTAMNAIRLVPRKGTIAQGQCVLSGTTG